MAIKIQFITEKIGNRYFAKSKGKQISIKAREDIHIIDQHRHIATIMYGQLRKRSFKQLCGALCGAGPSGGRYWYYWREHG